MIRLIFLAAVIFCSASGAEKESAWHPVKWNGERALASEIPGWKVIVSLERGRLVHFGPANSETNLLFAPPTRADPAGWGGHRLWLGPQATWSNGWPPPAAWEHSGTADSFTVVHGVLRLIMPDTADGWPRLIRTYHWKDNRLVCGAELAGGTRSAQIIHIMQVPGAALVDVSSQPGKEAPVGYVQLPSVVLSRFTTDFPPPPHVTAREKQLTLRHLATVQKLGFVPQPLIAHEFSFKLSVGRGEQTGSVASEPDRGFSTQVYLGGPEPFTELEQLSPSFSIGQSIAFAIELEGSAQ
jgi:hypothetical protein